MKQTPMIVLGVALALVATAMLFLGGVVGTPETTHPPCHQLPTRAEAAAALAAHREFADEIKASGDDIAVEVHNPCPADQDRGLIRVTYDSGAERKAVDRLIVSRDGFGVPLYVVKG